MVSVWVWDSRSVILCRQGYVPTIKRLTEFLQGAHATQNCHRNQRIRTPRDAYVAWTHATLTRWESAKSHSHSPEEINLQTWVIKRSPSNNTPLNAWFEFAGVNERYRVLIHTYSKHLNYICDPTYAYERLCIQAPWRPYKAQRRATKTLLEEWLQANNVPSTINSFLETHGHSYQSSIGWPTASERLLG